MLVHEEHEQHEQALAVLVLLNRVAGVEEHTLVRGRVRVRGTPWLGVG